MCIQGEASRGALAVTKQRLLNIACSAEGLEDMPVVAAAMATLDMYSLERYVRLLRDTPHHSGHFSPSVHALLLAVKQNGLNRRSTALADTATQAGSQHLRPAPLAPASSHPSIDRLPMRSAPAGLDSGATAATLRGRTQLSAQDGTVSWVSSRAVKASSVDGSSMRTGTTTHGADESKAQSSGGRSEQGRNAPAAAVHALAGSHQSKAAYQGICAPVPAATGPSAVVHAHFGPADNTIPSASGSSAAITDPSVDGDGDWEQGLGLGLKLDWSQPGLAPAQPNGTANPSSSIHLVTPKLLSTSGHHGAKPPPSLKRNLTRKRSPRKRNSNQGEIAYELSLYGPRDVPHIAHDADLLAWSDPARTRMPSFDASLAESLGLQMSYQSVLSCRSPHEPAPLVSALSRSSVVRTQASSDAARTDTGTDSIESVTSSSGHSLASYPFWPLPAKAASEAHGTEAFKVRSSTARSAPGAAPERSSMAGARMDTSSNNKGRHLRFEVCEDEEPGALGGHTRSAYSNESSHSTQSSMSSKSSQGRLIRAQGLHELRTSFVERYVLHACIQSTHTVVYHC